MKEYKGIENERVYEIIDKTSNSEINELINYIYNIVGEDDGDDLIEGIVDMVACLAEAEDSNQTIEEILLSELDFTISWLAEMMTSIVFDVRIVGLEDYVYRMIEVPYTFTLADLGYAVLGTMNASGFSPFTIRQGENLYVSLGYNSDNEDVKYADKYEINFLDLVSGDKLILDYVSKENYKFEITFIELNTHSHILLDKDIKIIETRGSGIWENEHFMQSLYYNNHDAYERHTEMYDLEGYELYYSKRENNPDLIKDSFYDSFLHLEERYENK